MILAQLRGAEFIEQGARMMPTWPKSASIAHTAMDELAEDLGFEHAYEYLMALEAERGKIWLRLRE